MKFGKSALVGLLMGIAGTADAFSISPHTALVQKLGRVQDDATSAVAAASTNYSSWRAPMKMVAGGAERAYGEDYYDGTYTCCNVCGCYSQAACACSMVWTAEPQWIFLWILWMRCFSFLYLDSTFPE